MYSGSVFLVLSILEYIVHLYIDLYIVLKFCTVIVQYMLSL